MVKTIATLNDYAEEFDITEVRNAYLFNILLPLNLSCWQPSLMNFCVTDGETVVVTRYISSKKDEAASLVRLCQVGSFLFLTTGLFSQWFSSGTEFSEYAEGGHYKMSKADKRENIIMVPCFQLFQRALWRPPFQIASEPLTFERGLSLFNLLSYLPLIYS